MIPLSAHLRTYKFADNKTEQEQIMTESEFITKYRPKLNNDSICSHNNNPLFPI